MRAFFARWVFGRTGSATLPMLSWPLALLLVLLLNGVAVYLLDRLTFNNSAEAYFPEGAAAVHLRDRLREDFPGDEVLTVLFTGDDLYGREFLGRLDRMVRSLEDHPLVDRVGAVTTMERITGTSDGFSVDRLVDVRKLAGASPEAIRQRVLSDRFAPGAVASADGRYMAVAVRPIPLSQSAERLQLTLIVAKAINEAGLRGHYAGEAGPITMDVAQLQSILSDSESFLPITVGLALALLFWVVGRVRPVVIGGMAIATVVLPSLAAVAVSGRPYTMASAILPSLLSAYTVVTLLHLYAGMQRAQRQSDDRATVVDTAIRETLRPSMYNVLTTSAGLLSLLLVPIPPIQLFGVVGALGTLVVFITVYLLVPPFLRHWDRKLWPQRGSGLGVLGWVSKRLTLFSMRWPKSIVCALAMGVVALYPQATQVKVETDMLSFFPADHPINVSTRLIESTLSGVTTLEISVQAQARDAFQRVDMLRELKRLQTWLEALPEVDRSTSMVDVVEQMHWAMNREREGMRAIPPNDRLLRQYLLVYDGEDLFELVNRDFAHARILLNLNVHATYEVGAAIEKIRAYVQAQPIAGTHIDVGGYGRLLSDQVELLVSGQTNSFFSAFGLIFLMMLLVFRTAVGSALCMLPNLAPLYFIFVLMGALGIALDSATVMIASVVLGITVDDTIHLYHGVRQRLARGVGPALAIFRSYEATGRAVMATSAILIGQFLLLSTSAFVPTSNFGQMTGTALAAGLVFELLLLPALLLLWHGRGRARAAGRPGWRARRTRLSGSRPSAAVDSQSPLPEDEALPAAFAPTVLAARDTPHSSHHVLVCYGDECKERGALVVWRRLRHEQKMQTEQGHKDSLRLTKTSCLGTGHCRFAPVAQVYPQGILYGMLEGQTLTRVMHDHLREGRPVLDLVVPADVSLQDQPARAR